MSKKLLTEEEKHRQVMQKKLEECLRPLTYENRFVKVTHYMLVHERYIKLSNSSKTLLNYMRDWAIESKQFWENGVFEFSYTLPQKLGFLSFSQTFRCVKELREAGFIDLRMKGSRTSTNKYSFSKRGFTGERETLPDG